MNIALYSVLPFLIPVLVSFFLIRLSLAARSSHARIKLLESDGSSREKLVHVLAQLDTASYSKYRRPAPARERL
ncbi:hypothetical protein DFH07DRAFT_955658 [Mycena maculata]|uniref:Uncharacterized protein n=1 Tax=Mycena maculata TaxID=230809 RepID=A0AAD7JM80_9AGAR|nr:hypothetical protein DFH07DRAFT_955658 [Mycena maculata]